jgi:hypothetical protein
MPVSRLSCAFAQQGSNGGGGCSGGDLSGSADGLPVVRRVIRLRMRVIAAQHGAELQAGRVAHCGASR